VVPGVILAVPRDLTARQHRRRSAVKLGRAPDCGWTVRSGDGDRSHEQRFGAGTAGDSYRSLVTVRLSVEFSWREVGAIHLDDGAKLVFPSAPETPGLYRFDFGDRIYVGETDRLRRRFQHYRTPGPTQTTNIRLNALIAEALAIPGTAEVSIVTEATIKIEGVWAELDLSHKSARLLLENAALTEARWAGMSVVNL